MRTKIAPHLTILLLLVVIATPGWGDDDFHGCSQEQVASASDCNAEIDSEGANLSELHQDLSQDKPTSPRGKDCCPVHCTGCNHAPSYLRSEHYFVLANHLITKAYPEVKVSMKPAPYLEGPFQPPRT